MRKINWELLAQIATVVGFLFVIVTAIFAFEQLKLLQQSVSTQNTISLAGQLFDPVNMGIIATIDKNKPIREINHGKFSDYQLDNYLGVYDLINQVYDEHFINPREVCDQFSYYASSTFYYPEIQAYLKEIRSDSKYPSDSFMGLDDLVKKTKNDPKCN